MKTVEQIKRKITSMQVGKCTAKRAGDDAGYRAYFKCERWLRWVIEDKPEKKIKNFLLSSFLSLSFIAKNFLLS